MRCFDRGQATDRVRTSLPAILRDIASTEEYQLGLEDAAPYLCPEDAEQVRQAATALRRGAEALREAEGILSDVNVALRIRAAHLAKVAENSTMAIVDTIPDH